MPLRPPSAISVFAFLPAAFALVSVFAAEAFAAPTIELTTTSGVTHTLPGGASFTRGPSLHPSGVNFEDCMLDVSINVPLTVREATAGANPLAVFAGTNCDTYTNRQIGGAGATCWPVVGDALAYTEGATYPVAVHVRQIAAQLYSGTKAAYSAVGSNAVCYSQPDSAARTVSLYFIVTTSDPSETVAVASTSIGVDLAAAAPPTRLSVTIGDTLLYPNWNAISDSDIVGFNVYSYKTNMAAPVKDTTVCDDAGSDAGDAGPDARMADANLPDGDLASGCHTVQVFDSTPIADGSAIAYDPRGFACASPFPVDTASDGGVLAGATETVAAPTTRTTDGGTASGDAATITSDTASIGPIELQPNESADTFALTAVAGDVTGARIANLANFTAYSVAVAAIDGYGNVGAFTSSSGEAVCQYPLPVTDFFTTYHDDGGEAGGSLCTLSTSDLPTGQASSAVVTGLALLWSRSRQTRRTRRSLRRALAARDR